MQQKLIYSYLRSEQDNTYTLFLRVEPFLLTQEIDVEITESKQLIIIDEAGNKLITDILTDEIHYSLANLNTVVIFADYEGEILGKQTFPPLDPIQRKK
jgi:flagellar assembly factor FliW